LKRGSCTVTTTQVQAKAKRRAAQNDGNNVTKVGLTYTYAICSTIKNNNDILVETSKDVDEEINLSLCLYGFTALWIMADFSFLIVYTASMTPRTGVQPVATLLFFFFRGVGLSLGTAATSGVLYKPQMINEGDRGAIGGMKIGRGNRSTRRKPAPAPLCLPQIPHDQTRARTPGRRGGKPATNHLSYGAARTRLLTYRTTQRSINVGFEPTTPVFEWAKTVHVLDRAATVSDKEINARK
jgi:hypothetical protein